MFYEQLYRYKCFVGNFIASNVFLLKLNKDKYFVCYFIVLNVLLAII